MQARSVIKQIAVSVSLLLSTLAYSQDFDTLAEDIFGGEDFLPVKEAFQPSIAFEGNNLVVNWELAPAYYLYKERFRARTSSGEVNDLLLETGLEKEDEFFGRATEVFYDRTQTQIPSLYGSGHLEIIAQGCAEAGLCYAPTSYWFEVDMSEQAVTPIDKPDEPFSLAGLTRDPFSAPKADDKKQIGFLLAIAMAFAGGLILNLMPCVFPVLAIKALKISTGGESAMARFKDSMAYTAGIVLTTVCIAGVMLILRSGGAQIGWGFQLQSPFIVIALMYLFFVVGLSFSGWILFGARFAGVGQNLVAEGKPYQSFFTGVLAMVVASPCSAPFMAASLGYAVSQPAWIAILVFAFLGIGMAFPLVLLNSSPALARRLPRPGPWMEKLKELLAFPMYLTSVWLLWVLIAQIGATGAALAVGGLTTLAAMFWAFKQEGSRAATVFALVMILSTGALAWKGASSQLPIRSEALASEASFSLSEFDAVTGGENPVFLDVTADWCITCKFNESRVLYTEEVQEMFTQKNVVYLVADWTNENADISALLERYDRVGIPLYLYFPAGSKDAQILPQILTKDVMRKYLAQPIAAETSQERQTAGLNR